MMTSWTRSGLMAARSTAARIAAAPSCGALKSFNSPWNAPMGVRAAEAMTTGSFGIVDSWLVLQGAPFSQHGSADAPGSVSADLHDAGVARGGDQREDSAIPH
jgi:hypothetical protein